MDDESTGGGTGSGGGISEEQRLVADVAIHLATVCERGVSVARHLYTAASARDRPDPRLYLDLREICIDLQRTHGDLIVLLHELAMKGPTP